MVCIQQLQVDAATLVDTISIHAPFFGMLLSCFCCWTMQYDGMFACCVISCRVHQWSPPTAPASMPRTGTSTFCFTATRSQAQAAANRPDLLKVQGDNGHMHTPAGTILAHCNHASAHELCCHECRDSMSGTAAMSSFRSLVVVLGQTYFLPCLSEYCVQRLTLVKARTHQVCVQLTCMLYLVPPAPLGRLAFRTCTVRCASEGHGHESVT